MVVKYFKYLLFIFIIFLSPRVYAYEYDVTSSIGSPSGGSSYVHGYYEGTELNGSTGPFAFNHRYQGTLTRIRLNIPVPQEIGECFAQNMTYTVTLNMATQDWRNEFGSVRVTNANTNFSNGRVNFVSTKKIYFTFKIPTSDTLCRDYVLVTLSSNDLFIPFTGETNWNLKSVILSDTLSNPPITNTPTPAPTSTPQNNQDLINANNNNTNNIINNQNNNTESIINNQNENTANTIENNNANTQSIIDNQNENTEKTNDLLGDCHKNLFNIFGYESYSSTRYDKEDRPEYPAIILTSNGNYTGGTFPLIYHVKLKPNTQYHFEFESANAIIGTGARAYFYVYHSVPSNTAENGLVYYTGSYTGFVFTTPSYDYQDYYIQLYITGTQNNGLKVVLQRPMLFEGTYHSSQYIPYNESVCTSKLDDTTSAINQVNDSINNSNVDSDTGNNFFNSFSTNDNGGISAIVTKPLVIVNNLLSNNSSCSNLSLPTFMGVSNAYLPSGCILWNNAPNSVISIWNIFVCGLGAYFVLKDLFRLVEDLKNPDKDKVEVLDL